MPPISATSVISRAKSINVKAICLFEKIGLLNNKFQISPSEALQDNFDFFYPWDKSHQLSEAGWRGWGDRNAKDRDDIWLLVIGRGRRSRQLMSLHREKKIF